MVRKIASLNTKTYSTGLGLFGDRRSWVYSFVWVTGDTKLYGPLSSLIFIYSNTQQVWTGPPIANRETSISCCNIQPFVVCGKCMGLRAVWQYLLNFRNISYDPVPLFYIYLRETLVHILREV